MVIRNDTGGLRSNEEEVSEDKNEANVLRHCFATVHRSDRRKQVWADCPVFTTNIVSIMNNDKRKRKK